MFSVNHKFTWGLLTISLCASAQNSASTVIQSISVCSAAGLGGAGSCPSGTFDTHQIVLASDGSGNAINSYQGMVGISDEHQSIFPPGALDGKSDCLFVVATRTQAGAPSTGAVFLFGGSGPGANGQWTLNLATADGYDSYTAGYGQVLVSPTGPNCPTVAGGNAAQQDQTFDLKYAVPGSVLVDPTSPSGSLLMIYEGTNTCLGDPGGPETGNFFAELAAYGFQVAIKLPTSLDGVSVTVNEIPAYVYYISPTQVNVLTPPNPLTGPASVAFTVNGTVSAGFTEQAQSASPSFFVINGGPYLVAQHAVSFTLAGPTTLYPGYTTPAKPGETVVIYANGFGPTSTAAVSGAETQSGTLSPMPSITIGGTAARCTMQPWFPLACFNSTWWCRSRWPMATNPLPRLTTDSARSPVL
jgi:uncharacterized protein (TIGR03437 family)